MRTNGQLTANERGVLLILLDNARVTDSEIAAKIRLTPQGVRKIRKKLEGRYILEYRTIVDYEKMGVHVFAVAQMKVINRDVLRSKNIIGAFEINESNITHILILGFSSLGELDDYKKKLTGDAEIQKINIISKKGFLKNTPVELLREQLKNRKSSALSTG